MKYFRIVPTPRGRRKLRQIRVAMTRGKDIVDHALTAIMAAGALSAILGACSIDSDNFTVPIAMFIGGLLIASFAGAGKGLMG